MPSARKAKRHPDAGRWGLLTEKNQRGQIGYIIVDTEDPDEPNRPFAAVLPESKHDKKNPVSRQRKAWAIAIELAEEDKKLNDLVDNNLKLDPVKEAKQTATIDSIMQVKPDKPDPTLTVEQQFSRRGRARRS